MPTITEISVQKNNKNRYNLFVDNEFFCGISIETIIKNHLKIGLIVETNKLKDIIFDDEKQQALTKAIEYISKALKTKMQLKEYLIKKAYSDEIVWFCKEKLKEYNYIDDKEYSKRYIECSSKTQGKRLIEYKLMMKGVKKEDIENAYSRVDIDQNENAKFVAQKYLKNKEITKENIAKTYRYLICKGFSYDEATYALKDFQGE